MRVQVVANILGQLVSVLRKKLNVGRPPATENRGNEHLTIIWAPALVELAHRQILREAGCK